MTYFNDDVTFCNATIKVKNVTDAITDFMNNNMAELFDMEENDSRTFNNVYVVCDTNMMRWSAEELDNEKPEALYYVVAKPNEHTAVNYDIWMDADGVNNVDFKGIDIEPLDMADMFH